MPYFLRDGKWQDIATNTVDTGGSGWTDEAGNYWSPQGELVRMSEAPIAMIGGANVNDPNRSVAPDFLTGDATNQFYEARGQVAPSAVQMTQTSPENYPGGFMGWINDQTAQGNIGNESQGLGGVAGFLRSHGYMVPLAAGAAFGGLAAAGAGAAAATPEAYMASAGLTPGAFEGAAFTMPSTLGSAGYTGINDYIGQAGLDTGGAYTPTYSSMNDYMAQAGLDAGKFEGAGFQMPSTLSAKDVLSTASRLKSLGSLLSAGGGGTGGTSQQQVANYLRGLTSPVQTNDYLGQIKMNQTPFFGGNQGTLSGENVYDVSGAMANALRKK